MNGGELVRNDCSAVNAADFFSLTVLITSSIITWQMMISICLCICGASSFPGGPRGEKNPEMITSLSRNNLKLELVAIIFLDQLFSDPLACLQHLLSSN
jgi:hypothetical protein